MATADGIAADAQSLFRVASISKIITGALIPKGSLNRDVSDLLGWSLRHPNWPDDAITIGMLAGHAAGLHDVAGYAVPPDMSLQDWVRAQGSAVWSAHRPGTHFDYANLGYVILGTATETLGRFDHQASTVLSDMGVIGGFNWSGVSAAHRAKALPTYRRDGRGFVAQIDGILAPNGVTDPDGKARDLTHYRPGQNAGLFAPQGGLRTSLTGMLAIARSLKNQTFPILWSPEMGTMDDGAGLFDQYGPGVQILRNPAFYPCPLIGHFANAYGFKGGVWYDAATDTAFSYALNGAAVGDESDDLSPAEQAIFAGITAACHTAP